MVILGIDPGLKATGYGIVKLDPKQRSNAKLLEAGTIEPKQKQNIELKLDTIYQNLGEIIKEYKPKIMVLEKLYSHYSYPTTASILGHARGVICLLCAQHKVELVEYSVKRIRKALVGNGNATKVQTREVVAHVLRIDKNQLTLDASDALALALGFAHIQRF